MRTLALPAGARVAVDPMEWNDALGVVTAGRLQLSLRDSQPGPVLECGAAFWLRGTGVRALRNVGPTTARVVVITPRPSVVTSRPHESQTPFELGGMT